MIPALLQLAAGREVSHELLAPAVLARRINQIIGGMAVLPWTVLDLPYEWLDLFDGMSGELPRMQDGMNRNAGKMDELRRQHYAKETRH